MQNSITDRIDLFPFEPNDYFLSALRNEGFLQFDSKTFVDLKEGLNVLAQSVNDAPKDEYYTQGDRYRTFNRFDVRVLEEGIEIEHIVDGRPYWQPSEFNETLGNISRPYLELPATISGMMVVKKIIARHVACFPMSRPGQTFGVHMHVFRFLASRNRPSGASPPSMHKDGEKYIFGHLLAYRNVTGGDLLLTDNDKRQLPQISLREFGEGYAFDDDRVWHGLTNVCVADDQLTGYRDLALFDYVPGA